MIIHEMEQRSDEWFEIKKGKFSASDATAIQANGKGLDTLVYKKIAELRGAKEEPYTNADMERGNEIEDLARTAYELETGQQVKQVGFIESDDHMSGCSPDGLVGEDGMAEIKCQRGYKFIELEHTRKIDKKYLDQMQMQMMIADRKWNDYVCFNEDLDSVVIIRVDADPEMHIKLKKGLAAGIKKMTAVSEALK